MKTQTKKIAGHSLTLSAGTRYLATRPMASHVGQRFDVTIRPVDGRDVPEVVVPGLDYEAATSLVNRFNDGSSSFDGRVW